MKIARVTVQFQSVIEKLSPHDTIFFFAQPAELRESAFSSACSLHTATASIKSSNDSLIQKGLAEITEDVSESRADTVEGRLAYGGDTRDVEQSPGTEDNQIQPERVNGFTSADHSHHRSTSPTTQSSFRTRTTSNTEKPLPPPPPEGRIREDASPGSILDYAGYNTRPSMDGRFSSNSTRPSTRDLYDAYGYKKKAKVGPRPSTDSVRSPTNSGIRTNDFRPVSTLPAGLRMPSRKAVPARPASRQALASPPIQTGSPVRPSPPAQANSSEKLTPRKAPTEPVAPIHIPSRNTSTPKNGSRTPRIPEPVSPKMTPEKQRLMKALQLRQKQMATQNSVNGLGIKNVSEPELSKSGIDDSIISAVIDASTLGERDEPVPIATRDLAKDNSRLLEDSPISMPGTAEEPSTQASSITDDEEAVAPKRQEDHSALIPSVSENQDLSFKLAENPHSHMDDSQDIAPEDSGNPMLTEAAVILNAEDLSQPSAPARSDFFLAGQDVVEHKVAREGSPQPTNRDHSHVMAGQVPYENQIVTAEEIGGDEQLYPNQLLGSQVPGNQSVVGDKFSLFDRGDTSTAESGGNGEFQQSETLDDSEKAVSTGDTVKDKDLHNQSLENDDEVHYIMKTDNQEQVLQSQSEQGRGQPVRDFDGSALERAPNDNVKPLLIRRSSSSKSITVPSDNINPHEIPLPPIDEDEEISLSPQRASFRRQAAAHHTLHNGGESKTTIMLAKVSLQNGDHSVTGHSNSNDVGDGQTDKRSERQGAVNPIKRMSSPDHSDEQFLSDDSFMEELKSATVQEAKPISVSKSPIKPVFSRSESEQTVNESASGSRSVSTPINHSTKDREVTSSSRPPTPMSTPRSFSAQHAQRPDSQQSHVPMSKKIGVSSSISQRIKALEQLSSRPTSPISPNLAPNTSNFVGLRTTSLRTPSGGSDYRKSNFNKSRPDKAYPSPSPSPEIINSSLLNQSHETDYSGPNKSATATNIRDAKERSPEGPSNSSEPHPLGIRESPLQLELQKSSPPADHNLMGPPPLSPLKPPRPRFGRYASTRSGSSSSNEQKLEPPPSTRRDSFASIRSKSSRAGSEVELPHTLSDSSLSGKTSLDSTHDEKKDSRRSRLMKRMSNISSMSRRSIANALSPGPKEAPIIERQEPIQEAPSTSVHIGDVNVQFPDNLVKIAFTLLLTLADITFLAVEEAAHGH